MGSIKKNNFSILRRPRITEKSAIVRAESNCVVFDVHPKANKVEIKQAVEKIFDAKVASVRTLGYSGKLKRVGKSLGRRNNWKKAYVSLQEGSTLDVIEGL